MRVHFYSDYGISRYGTDQRVLYAGAELCLGFITKHSAIHATGLTSYL